ncbi:MAG: tetratricopeptide repeat protein [Deltaproteobacteria bacterium]|nr:tetratricopeptide repeat protein [Deltaproteobacteria bacterium]
MSAGGLGSAENGERAVREAAETALAAGNQCFKAGRIEEGEKHWRKAIKLATKHAPDVTAKAVFSLGTLCRETGRLEEAEQHYRTAIALGTKHAQDVAAKAAYNLGNLCYEDGRLDEAERHYRQAIALGTEHAPDVAAKAAYKLGNLCFETGRLDEAERYYRQAIALGAEKAPEAAASAAGNLGSLCYRAGRLDEAERYWLQAIALCPKHAPRVAARAAHSLGVLRSVAGLPREAVIYFDGAHRLAQQALHAAGDVLATAAGDHDLVMTLWRAALGAAQAERQLGRPEMAGQWLRAVMPCFEELACLALRASLENLAADAGARAAAGARRARGAAVVFRQRAQARLALAAILGSDGPDAGVAPSEASKVVDDVDTDLKLAESIEVTLPTTYAAVPLLDSGWLLLDALPWFSSARLGELQERLAGLCLDKAEEACSLCEEDERGAASAAPVLAAAELLARAIAACLHLLEDSSQVALRAVELAMPLVAELPSESDPVHGFGELDAARAQLCAALLVCLEAEQHAGEDAGLGLLRLEPEQLTQAMCCYADRGLAGAREHYRELLASTRSEEHLDFRASRTALFRTHLEAHLRKAWLAAARSRSGSAERTATAESAAELFRAVFENRSVIDLVERERLGRGSCPAACARPGVFRGWLSRTHAAWLEVVVALSLRAELLVRPGRDGEASELEVTARIRQTGWEQGLPAVLLQWSKSYDAFWQHVRQGFILLAQVSDRQPFAASGETCGAGGRELPAESALGSLDPAVAEMLNWAKAQLDGSKLWLRVSPDSVLHDVPWVALGGRAGLQVAGQALSAASVVAEAAGGPAAGRCESAADAGTTALFVVARGMAEAYDRGSDSIEQGLVRPLVEAGWTVHRLDVGDYLPRTTGPQKAPEWRCRPCCAGDHDLLRPALVVWLNHGNLEPGRGFGVLGLHHDQAITAAMLMAAANARSPLALPKLAPGFDVRLDLSGCRALLSGACLSGRIDPRFGPEGVGLVRGLMALGVREVFAPSYDALLTPAPGGQPVMLRLLRAMLRAAMAGASIGPTLHCELCALMAEEAKSPGAGMAERHGTPWDWWWGHATVFSR